MPITLNTLEDLLSWGTYRPFMKERLKQLKNETCPIYVSKKKLDFDFDGKPWKGHAVLVGLKGELAAKKLRKKGTQFFIGTCRPNGGQFEVEGLPDNTVKLAHLTLKKLRLGCSIAGVADEDLDEGADAASEAARPASAVPLERAPEVWSMTRRHVKAKTDQLKDSIRKAFAGEGREIIAGLEKDMKTLDRVFTTLDDDLGQILDRAAKAADARSRSAELAAAKALLARHVKYVMTEPLIKHIDSNPFGVQTNLQATLAKSLKHVASSIG